MERDTYAKFVVGLSMVIASGLILVIIVLMMMVVLGA